MEKELVRSVVRAFYETEHIVIIDALVKHSACTLDDLRHIFISSRLNKELLKVVSRLRDGALVTSYGRQETKLNAQKATTVEYFYIDYRRAIDATKYRLHMLQEKLVQHSKPTTEKKEFTCPQCKAQWTLLEVLDDRDPAGRGSGFLCKRCASVLKYTPTDKEDEIDGDNPLSVFNKQFDWLIKILGQIDRTVIPEVTPESALEAIIPIPKPKSPLEMAKSTSEDLPKARPSAVMGIKSGPEKVEITLTTDLESNVAAQQAEADRRAKVAAQNELPSWHTQSTVAADAKSTAQKALAEKKGENSTSAANNDNKDEPAADEVDLEQFYKEMAEHQRLADLARQEEETDDDEDVDEFEDVEPLPNAKRLKPENGSVSAAGTPVGNGTGFDKNKGDDASAKASDSNVGTPLANSTPAQGGEESDEDDEEFEEVV